MSAAPQPPPPVAPTSQSRKHSAPILATWRAARWIHGGIAVAALLLLIIAVWRAHCAITAEAWSNLLNEHGPALLGLPIAVGISTILVSSLRAIDGPLRIEFLGLRAKGAGATVLYWVFAFVAVGLVVRALW